MKSLEKEFNQAFYTQLANPLLQYFQESKQAHTAAIKLPCIVPLGKGGGQKYDCGYKPSIFRREQLYYNSISFSVKSLTKSLTMARQQLKEQSFSGQAEATTERSAPGHSYATPPEHFKTGGSHSDGWRLLQWAGALPSLLLPPSKWLEEWTRRAPEGKISTKWEFSCADLSLHWSGSKVALGQ